MNKKKMLYFIEMLIIIFSTVMPINVYASTLKLSKEIVETNSKGTVTIKGHWKKKGTITIEQERSKKTKCDNHGNFKLHYTFPSNANYTKKEITITAVKGKSKDWERMIVKKNSKINSKTTPTNHTKSKRSSETPTISKKSYDDNEGKKNYQQALSTSIDAFLKETDNVGKSIFFPKAIICPASKDDNLWIGSTNNLDDKTFTNFQGINIGDSDLNSGDIVEIQGVIVQPHKSIVYNYDDGIKYPTIDIKNIKIIGHQEQ